MTRRRQLIFRSLRFYARSHFGSVLGVAVAGTVLVGALAVGDCARESLREIRKADKSSAPLSLILADIDHFKRINDNFGHPIGDEVLKKFAEILQAGAGESGSVARYGGEEFAIILPATSAPAAGKLADEIRERLESTKWLMRGVTPLGVITASFGVAQHHAEESPDSLIQRADAKLYLSKATGRNRVSR